MIAIAKAFGLSLSLKEIQQVSDETPLLANLKPSGQYMMQDLHNVGGIPAVMKLMYKEGLLFSTAMTVTGMTVAENLENVQDLTESQKVIYPISQPIKSSGHLQMLFGNLAKEGSVAKITGKEGLLFEGKAKVYDSEAAANEAIQNNQIEKGNVIVIRYCGPKGGPGMPEMLKPTGLIMGSGLGKHVALITDGRFSGGSHGFVVGHITPEAYNGGIIALLEDGDTIKIDAESNTIDVALSDEEILRRRNNRVKPNDKPIGVLAKYRQNGITKSLQHLKFQKYLLKHSTSRTQEGLGLS